MILKSLFEFAMQNGLRAGYPRTKITDTITLDAQGHVIDTKSEEVILVAPGSDKNRGQRIDPGFFVDDQDYILGVNKKTPELTVKRHRAFCDLVDRLAAQTQDPGILAVKAFLSNPEAVQAVRESKAEEEWEGKVAFRFEDDYVFNRKAVLDAWETFRSTESRGRVGKCSVTGDEGSLVRLHSSIKGLPGSKGSNLISFNLGVTQFEGREQGENCDISTKVAEGYASALNHMLSRDDSGRMRHAFDIGADTVLILWTSDNRDVSPYIRMLNPAWPDVSKVDAQGKKLDKKELYLKNIGVQQTTTNQAWDDISNGTQKDVICYVLILRPNMTRVMILDWFELPLDVLTARLLQFRSDFGGGPVSLKAVLQSLSQFDKPSIFNLDIVRSILTGSPYPEAMSSRSTMILPREWWNAIQARKFGKEIPMSLKEDHPSQAYHLGRLAAIAEVLKSRAVGVKNGLTTELQKASRSPAQGMQDIFKQTQRYVDKLRHKAPTMGSLPEVRLYESLFNKISSMPLHHTVVESGDFWCGYGHQKNDMDRQTKERIAASQEKKRAEMRQAAGLLVEQAAAE